MALNDKLFLPKPTVCPICEKNFTRFLIRKKQFSLDKRDIDYRPVYLGNINPRFFNICICPHCYYAAEDKYFCPVMSIEDMRKKELLDSHRSQWDAASRVRAASSGQQIWKDAETEKLKELTPGNIAILRKITPLLEKVAANLIQKEKPINELQKDGDLDAAVRSWELAAICYKARKANHRILGYTYLNAAWTARDAAEQVDDPQAKERFKAYEKAYLTEATSFLTITNMATSVEDAFMPDGTRIPKENIPQSRVFEIMYILAGAYRLLGKMEESNKYLEQIIYGSQNASGIILWFVNQAREMRQDETAMKNLPIPQEEPEEDEDY
ncbi:MAG: uncharacterized protein PWR01_2163 [Clostridiales bacterium]|jgi:uncharacterized protein (DUF2225 family)|nr:uncharacterized protein [Clostridiales bacterium]MDN5281090.1 uncharacterized protein [Candidatus Ozemobacter sp.]